MVLSREEENIAISVLEYATDGDLDALKRLLSNFNRVKRKEISEYLLDGKLNNKNLMKK